MWYHFPWDELTEEWDQCLSFDISLAFIVDLDV